MSNFLAWLWLIASCFFVVYLVKWLWARKKKGDMTAKFKKYTLYSFLASVALFVGAGMTSEDTDTTTSSNSSSSSSSVVTKKNATSATSSSSSDSSSSSTKKTKKTTKKVVKKTKNTTKKVVKKINYSKAKTYRYGELVKSNDHAGEPYVIKAQVLQAQEDSGYTTLLVYTNDDPDELYAVYYDGKTSAIEDDYVYIKGLLGKLYSYDTQIGGSNTVPTIGAKSIKVVK